MSCYFFYHNGAKKYIGNAIEKKGLKSAIHRFQALRTD